MQAGVGDDSQKKVWEEDRRFAMAHRRSVAHSFRVLGVAGIALLALAGCSGNDGAQGPAGTSGVSAVAAATATSLNVTITGVTVASPPVVTFSATDQNGAPVTGMTLTDMRFTIAKLMTGANGNPSAWQNYVNIAASGNLRPIAEGGTPTNCQTSATTVCGTLVDNHDGTYKYTFKTDIANATCPTGASCTDISGNAIDLSYNSGLTHRVGLQTRGALPIVNVTYEFKPSTGATTGLFAREIVRTGKCNECHNKLAVHGGSRIETKFCVTCHNPGNMTPGTSGTTAGNLTVDFKVMIHKIHMGEDLPSVLGADGVLGTADDGKYLIGTSSDFSSVVFPQDIRNCTKCHDGADTATPQGDNWKSAPSREACGSCHDNVNFATGLNHTGGAQPDNSTCQGCHSTGGAAGPVETSHARPALLKAESAKYKFNILTVTNTGPTQSPVITFSITDPTSADAKYDLKGDTRLSSGSLSMVIGWNNADENNNGSTRDLAQPVSVSLTGSGAANAVDNGDRTYTVNLATAASVTGSRTIPASMTGSGRVALYGRAAVDVDPNTAGAEVIRIKAGFKDFAITDATPKARRQVVDITKCDKCHDQLSLHGDSRTDEPGLCVICHNPNATDLSRRPRATLTATASPGPCAGQTDTAGNPALANAINCNPAAGGSKDSKKEESIDFKRMIHGIHAAAKKDYTGATAHGIIRNNGLVVYGFFSGAGPVNPVDFSHVRFPGILNNCLTCHVTPTGSNPGNYELAGTWEVPTQNGVLGSTIDTAPLTTDSLSVQTDDLNITPTASVCTSCHDGQVAKSHMTLNGALFSATQATINLGTTLEACAICHGPGRLADIKVVHDVK
jgi:OmcA/MtrC family decaheme c-type cytochrome